MFFNLSETEKNILELLWKNQRWMSGAEFWEYFNANGKTSKRQTINTYLSRMVEKGILIKYEKKYMYTYTRKEWEEKKAHEILSTLFDGSLKSFIVALTGNKKISKEEADELKEYLNNFDEKDSPL